METVCFVFVLIVHLHAVSTYLLSSPDSFPKLPQYVTYGKSLVLVGGNLYDNNTEIYDTIIRLAGGRGVAIIGIINAASEDPVDSYNFYHDLFLKYGVREANRIPVDLNHTGNYARQEVIDLILNQTGFFFGGGDQARILMADNIGNDNPALLAVRQMFERGAVISGTSAGLTCQTSRVMFEDGVSYETLKYGSFPSTVINVPTDATIYSESGGIGFFDKFVLDSHFSQRGREGRMIRLLSDTKNHPKGSNFGMGIDENTALVVTHAGTNMETGEVIGAAGVSVFDLSKSTVLRSSYFHISSVYMSYLTHGDVIRLSDMQITFSSRKTPLHGHEHYDDVLSSNDVFSSMPSSSNRKPEFVRIATSVFDAKNSRRTYGTTYENHPRFHVELSATKYDAEGWVERKQSFHTDITSYKNLFVEIYDV